MSEVAASRQGREYKSFLLDALQLAEGQTALDVGCGPGTDLGDLADGVGRTGAVLGVDHGTAMARLARDCLRDRAGVEIVLADAHALPLPSGSVDRLRVDRVVQHVTSPADVFRELRRVAAPGARAVVAEPDWGTLAIDTDHVASSDGFVAYTRDLVVPNATIGRQLPRLAATAGFDVETVRAFPAVFVDVEQADRLLGLVRNSVDAVASGYLDSSEAEGWLASLHEGTFFAVVTLVTVVATVP